MKYFKSILFFFLFFLCFKIVISSDMLANKLYIESLGIEYTDKYKITLFSPSSLSVGKSESSSDVGSTVITIESESLEDLFNKAEASTDFEINYRHLKSVVFHKSYLSYDMLKNFIYFIINSEAFDFDFYIFTTEEKLSDIYSFKNPDNVSSYYSILDIDSHNLYLFDFVNPVKFTNFIYFFDYKNNTIKIPLISSEKLYTIDNKEEISLYISGVSLINSNKISIIYQNDYVNLRYLNSSDETLYYLKDFKLIVKSCHTKYKYKNNLKIDIAIIYKNLYEEISEDVVIESLTKNISLNLNQLYSEGIDYLNLEYINYLYNKSYTISDVKLNLELKKYK